MDAPFVGRQREIALLRAAVVSAGSGVGRLVLVGGPAGIGKSRLVEELAAIAGEYGMPIARGYAVDDPGMPALWPWRRLARHVPGPTQPLSVQGLHSATDRFELFTGITDWLRAAAEADGLVVVLEDMHWSDDTSLLLLRQIAADLLGARLVLVVTYRDVVTRRDETPLGNHLPDLLRAADARTIELGGLSTAEIARWLATAVPGGGPAVAAELHARTGGNPLFVRLLVESARDPADLLSEAALHPQVRRLVLAQLTRLSADARAALDAASVLGERIEPVVLAPVLDRSEDEVTRMLAEASGAGVTTLREGRIAFAHSLIRDAVYAELSPLDRAALHRRTAEVLSTRVDAELVAGIVATHWHRAGGVDDRRRCAEWARRAADSAMGAHAYAEAITFRELELEASGSDTSPAQTIESTLALARAEFAAGRITRSLAHCTEVAAAAERAGRPRDVAAAALVIEGIGSPEVLHPIDRICRTALHLLPADETALRSRLESRRVIAVIEDEDVEFAREISARALELAEHSEDPIAVLDGLHARHLALSAPQFVDERLVIADRALEMAWAAGKPLATLWALLWRIEAAMQLGDTGLADRTTAEVEQLASSRRLPIAQWHLCRIRAARALLTGDLAAAEQHNDAALVIGRAAGDMSLTGMHLAFRAQLNVVRGQVSDPDGDVVAIGAARHIALARIFLPITHALVGDTDSARAAFEEFRMMPETVPIGPRWAALLIHIGLAATLLDDAETADRVYRKTRDLDRWYSGEGTGPFYFGGAMARMIGDVALTAGHVPEAIDLYRRAIEMNARIGARPFIAQSRLGLAQALTARNGSGDSADARQSAVTAAGEFRRIGMPGHLRTADRLIAQLDAAARDANPLSARETEVAGLVAEGLANREIATRLVLSERTVETHVRSILAKLGCANRTEIAAWALRPR
ncbi:LuxR C-terminal-related transcriptional regulator [Aldersonia sp. NBC_00410]|uniref:ATP-binding protein n=1 Tax=Aldersonia sp. NBC_00410 TaxID=2975954 RepID=UPI0022522909|nr:helix-turn-helix transcriptional regulator [Aldersonia sp. NBC_00410]MCX5041899.1 LuxR C-terminal-related transcriptional regulator [Aldersonia sp. NBC_00410]